MDFLGVERLFARNQEIWEIEYNKFVKELSAFMNKELKDFWHNLEFMGDTTTDAHIHNIQVCEIPQATS